MLGDAREHPRPDLVAIVEREHVVRPSVAGEGLWEPVSRLMRQPIRRSAASTRRARVEGQAATNEPRYGES